eukprot:g41174.t1
MAIRLQAPGAEHKVLLLQFAEGVIVALEEAQDGHVTKGVGGGVKMVGNQKVLLFVMCRVQMLHETVPESALGLTDVEETISGATDAVEQVGGCTGEHLSDMKGLLWVLNGGEGGGVGPDVAFPAVAGKGARDGGVSGECGLDEGVTGKVDGLFKLLVGAQGSTDTVIKVAEDEVGYGASVIVEKGLFHVTYKEAGIARTMQVPVATPLVCRKWEELKEKLVRLR